MATEVTVIDDGNCLHGVLLEHTLFQQQHVRCPALAVDDDDGLMMTLRNVVVSARTLQRRTLLMASLFCARCDIVTVLFLFYFDVLVGLLMINFFFTLFK